MKIFVLAASTLLLAPALAAGVAADEPAPLALGSRLRVTANDRIIGRLLAQD